MPVTRRQALLSAGALAAATTLPRDVQAQTISSNQEAPPVSDPVCLGDYEPLAQSRMSHMAWEYVNAGAADEITLRSNIEAYRRLRLQASGAGGCLAVGYQHHSVWAEA